MAAIAAGDHNNNNKNNNNKDVVELPVGRWTQDYKEWLLSQQAITTTTEAGTPAAPHHVPAQLQSLDSVPRVK